MTTTRQFRFDPSKVPQDAGGSTIAQRAVMDGAYGTVDTPPGFNGWQIMMVPIIVHNSEIAPVELPTRLLHHGTHCAVCGTFRDDRNDRCPVCYPTTSPTVE